MSKRRIAGYVLIILFGVNLLSSLLLTFGIPSMAFLPAVIISLVMILVGYRLVRQGEQVS